MLAFILITIAPLWVPALMASKAPFKVVNDPDAVPEVAVKVTCENPVKDKKRVKHKKIAF